MATQNFPVQGLPSQGIGDLQQLIMQKLQTITVQPTLIIPMDQYKGKFKRKARWVGILDMCIGIVWLFVAVIYTLVCFLRRNGCFGEEIRDGYKNRTTFYYFYLVTLIIGCFLSGIEIYTAIGLGKATNYCVQCRDESRRKAKLWLGFNVVLIFYLFNVGCLKFGMGYYVSAIPDFLSFGVRLLFVYLVQSFIPEMEMGGPETFKADESHRMTVQAVFMKPEIE